MKKYMKILFTIIILLICECIFFRNIIFNDSLIGDLIDGRFTNLIAEHWWNFFKGKESFFEVSFFYPGKNVIGYSDLLLGLGVIHSIFRYIGFDMFISYKITIIFIHFMGTLFTFYLFYKTLKCNYYWSLFGTIVFSFSNAYSNNLYHTQLVCISLLPLLLILAIGFIRKFENRKSRNIYAYSFILLFVLLTYTSWYTAYFTVLFLIVFFIVYIIKLKKRKFNFKVIVKDKNIKFDIIFYTIFGTVLYIPFIFIELPLFGSSKFLYEDYVYCMPEILDFINVGENNFMIGWFIKLILNKREKYYFDELKSGFSLILLILFFFLMFVYKKKDNNKEFIETVFITIIVCMILILRLSNNGVSLWWLIYSFVPFAKTIRAVSRLMLWLSFPIVVITTYLANKYINYKIKRIIPISLILVLLVFIFNIDKEGIRSEWNLKNQRSFIENIEKPPLDVSIFYIINSKNDCQPIEKYIYQIDAFEIASYYSLKTINGYSSSFPKGWIGVLDICSDDYERSVHNWIKKNKLKNVYAYDIMTNTWIKHDDIVEELNLK